MNQNQTTKIPEDKYELMYNYLMMKSILEKIAGCSEGSTIEGARGLAQMTLDGLK